MTSELLLRYHSWFKQFTQNHTMDNAQDQRNIDLKIAHTARVVKAIKQISQSIALDRNDTLLAQTMALFHDVGRFPQYKVYKTFKDSISKNHAMLSIEELEQQKILSDLPSDEKALIIKAIAYHNALELPHNLTQRERLFAELLRDADKVDILYVVTSYYETKHESQNKTIELELSDATNFTPAILSSFLKGKAILYDDMEAAYDFKLLQLGWINDLNFQRSLELIIAGNYFQKIIDTLPASKDRDKISNYLEKRIEEKLCTKQTH